MYTKYFGFEKNPFSIVPNPQIIYPSYQHLHTLETMRSAISHLGGIWMLTGEVGMGKTTLTRAFITEIPSNIELAYILYANVSEIDLYKQILNELDIVVPEDTKSQWQLINRLNRYLLEQSKKDKHLIIVIEEAQNLSEQLLENLRTLTNLETDESKLLTILLVGQSELLQTIDRKSLRQLKQRIAVNVHLPSFKLRDTIGYINYRLREFNGADHQIGSFAKILIHLYARGVPRVINNLCHKALQNTFQQKKHRATIWQVIRANSLQKSYKLLLKYCVVLVFLVATVFSGLHWQQTVAIFNKHFKAQVVDGQKKPIDLFAEIDKVEPLATALTQSLTHLEQLWQKKSTVTDSWQQYCDQLRELQCYSKKRVNYKSLLQINLPAIIEFYGAKGGVSAVIRKIDAENDSVEIYYRSKIQSITITQFKKRWNGSVKLLWRPPESYKRVFYPNQRNKSLVDWMQVQLNKQGVMSERYITGGLYNDLLVGNVKKFQKKHKLFADGVLGIRTIMAMVDRDEATPTLFE